MLVRKKVLELSRSRYEYILKLALEVIEKDKTELNQACYLDILDMLDADIVISK